MKKKLSQFNDGYIKVCEPVKNTSNFGAQKNVATENDLQLVLRLAYSERSRRESDLEFAESIGRSLNLKVCTPIRPEPKMHHQVLIGRMLYSIINIDHDRANGEMYFYLEEGKELAKTD